jgi:hypothetical protein
MTAPSPEQLTRQLKPWSLRHDAALVEDTAEMLNVSPNTVLRDWRLGRTWLTRAMGNTVAIK